MIFLNWKPERIFLVVALIVGFLLVIITPPMCTPDENAHFMNAYFISKGDIFPEVVDGQIGRYVSSNVMDFLNNNRGRLDGKLEEKYTFTEFYFNSWLTSEKTEEVFYATELNKISPIGYTFSALGMAIGSILLSPIDEFELPYNLLLFGRFFNLAFYISCIYYAIKITPWLKRSMLLVALMPMSIFLGASVNYDAILISISMLLFAEVLKVLDYNDDTCISKSDIMIVLLCTFFLVGVKQAYAPLLLVLFAIPIRKFTSKKNYIILIATTFGVGVISYIPSIIMNFITRSYNNPYIDYITRQKEYLFTHLNEIPSIIVNSFKTFVMFYIPGFFGKLGQIDTNIPIPVIVLFLLSLFLVAIIELSNSPRINYKIRLFSIISVIMSICLLMYAMYIYWTCLPGIGEVGLDYVSGIQGRYFIPLFLFGCLPLANNILNKIKMKEKIIILSEQITQIAIMCCGVLTIFVVFLRYW